MRLLQLALRGLGALGGLSAPFTPEAPAPGTMPGMGWAHSPRLLTCTPCQPTYPVPGLRQPLEIQAWALPPPPPGRGAEGLLQTSPKPWTTALSVPAFHAQTVPATAQ